MTAELKDLVTPSMIDYLLYNLPEHKELIESIMPKTSTSVVLFHPKMKTFVHSKVENVAVQRAILMQVIDAIEKAIRRLPTKEHKRIYRMKWREGMSVREISKRLYRAEDQSNYSTGFVQDKCEQVRDLISLALLRLPVSQLREFCYRIDTLLKANQ